MDVWVLLINVLSSLFTALVTWEPFCAVTIKDLLILLLLLGGVGCVVAALKKHEDSKDHLSLKFLSTFPFIRNL